MIVKKFLIRFTILYIFLMILTEVIAVTLGAEDSSHSFLPFLSALIYSLFIFSKSNARILSDIEKKKITVGVTLISIFIKEIFTYLPTAGDSNESFTVLLIFLLIFSALVQLIVTYFFVGIINKALIS